MKLKDECTRTNKLSEALAIEDEIRALDGLKTDNVPAQPPDVTNVEPTLFIASGKKYYFVGKVMSQDDAISYGATKGWRLATFKSAREAKALLKAFEELGDKKLPDHHFGHVRTGMGFSKLSEFTIAEQPVVTDAKEKAELLSLMSDVYRNPEFRTEFTEVTIHYRMGSEASSRNPTLFRRDMARNNGEEVNPTVLGCIYEEAQK